MTNELGTLAYTKSPKTSKRTKFQDELQAAISARAKKVTMDEYSDDFNDDDDEFFNELLKSRKKNAFKASKAKVVNFEFSDDEDKPAKSKRVSFLKTQRISSTLEGPPTDKQKINEHSNASIDGCGNQSSTNVSDQSFENRSDVESTHSQDTQERNRSLPNQTSEEALQDKPPPVSSCDRVDAPNSLITGVNERGLPTPKPRQRILGATNQDKPSEFQDLHRQPTSVPLSSELSNEHPTSNDSPNLADGDNAVLTNKSQSFSSMGEPSMLTKSTVDSGSIDGCNSDDSRDQGLSFEEPTISQPSATVEDSGDQTDCSVNHPNAHVSDNSQDTLRSDTLTKGSQKTRSVFQKKVESKYLGTLKVLDQSLQDSEPQSADTLRAAVYQEWLKKKREKSKHNMDIKKEEDIVQEKKKEDKEAKREDAHASYEAWKEKKLESLKVKTKEKQEKMRKEQKARDDKEEKMQTAKQVFEKWKHEHDHILKEKYRKARRVETEQKLQKQEKEDERKRSNSSAFSEWSEKKKTVLQERATAKCKEIKDTEQTEHYLKEEKDKLALDMYESWLARKNLEKKRHKEERWFQGILEDSPPPPWSPPNKTIPYRK